VDRAVVEAVPSSFQFSIVSCDVGLNMLECPMPSVVLIQLKGRIETLNEVIDSVTALAVSKQYHAAVANTRVSPATSTAMTIKNREKTPKRVLLFGSGRVAKPIMRLLGQVRVRIRVRVRVRGWSLLLILTLSLTVTLTLTVTWLA
jgi:hypothetical protein